MDIAQNVRHQLAVSCTFSLPKLKPAISSTRLVSPLAVLSRAWSDVWYWPRPPKPPLGSHMPINLVQRTHTQIHAPARLHVLLMLMLMLMLPLLYFRLDPYPSIPSWQRRSLACIASATHIHLLYPPANRPASAHAYNRLTCLHTLLLSRTLAVALFACAAPSPLSLASVVSCHPPPFICPPHQSVFSCSPASHPPHSEPTSLDRWSPKMRALHCTAAGASGTDSAANGADAASCPTP
jgi:hypothetical protein